jgi:YVTN family beta-propeller protein
LPEVESTSIKPLGIRIDAQQRFAYVALGRANRIAVIDVKKLQVIDYLLVGKRVWNIEFSPDQKRLYAANGISNDVSIIDLEKRKVLMTVPVGQSPWGIAVQ